MTVEFKEFGKIPRFNRLVYVTEKIDGTNACVVVDSDCRAFAQSRSRLITPESDNFGFAGWVKANADELSRLGPGHHFGEWWGVGIQRGYGLTERRFSLFNSYRWQDAAIRPKCCDVVPVLAVGLMSTGIVEASLAMLSTMGSFAAPGFDKPEGVVVYHTAGNLYFKATLDKDDGRKGSA